MLAMMMRVEVDDLRTEDSNMVPFKYTPPQDADILIANIMKMMAMQLTHENDVLSLISELSRCKLSQMISRGVGAFSMAS